MTYKTLMVHLELNGDNDGVLAIAGDLAERFGAMVIGIAACQPLQVPFDTGYMATDVLAQDRTQIHGDMAAVEAQFRKALDGRARELEWRSTITYGALADYIADEARAADLIITGRDIGASLLDESRRVNIGRLALEAGRPVLLVPQGITALPLARVFVGWKESREARRAAADAVPLLRLAGDVTVMEVTDEAGLAMATDHVDDVAAWLIAHGVSARPEAVAASGLEAGYLHAELLSRKCDLLVAGAYGHSKLGEFLFGGVTEDILLDPDFCVLFSH